MASNFQSLSDILRQAQAEDVRAVELIIHNFSGVIESECARIGLAKQPDWSHSDLQQEVWLQVVNKLKQFNEVDNENVDLVFRKWLRITARSVLSNLIRKNCAKKRKPPEGIEPFDEQSPDYFDNQANQHTPSSVCEHNEINGVIRKLMETHLDPQSQLVFSLRFNQGLSLTEIEKRTQMTYEQVRYKYQSAIELLGKKLADLIE